VTPLDDGRHWRLVQPFDYHVGSLSSTEIIRVPAGFVTDFASVPRLLWYVIPPWGRYGKAAVVHDFCYTHRLYSRRRADRIFLEAMKALSVPLWKRIVMVVAVRIFGWWAWMRAVQKLSAFSVDGTGDR